MFKGANLVKCLLTIVFKGYGVLRQAKYSNAKVLPEAFDAACCW
jgi:hypothetical protein